MPITRVLSVASDLENHVVDSAYSYDRPAFLGIGLADGGGTTVQQVYDATAAARAGIVAGDRITRVGGQSVGSAAALQRAIRGYSPGDRMSVTWTDDAGSHTATVTLGTGPVA